MVTKIAGYRNRSHPAADRLRGSFLRASVFGMRAVSDSRFAWARASQDVSTKVSWVENGLTIAESDHYGFFIFRAIDVFPTPHLAYLGTVTNQSHRVFIV